MPPTRFPGPICQTKDWYEDVEDGTLARMPSPDGNVLGQSPATALAKTPARVVASGACSFLNPVARGTVTAPKEVFERLRKNAPPAQISPTRPKASQTWPDGSTSAALEQEIQIGNQQIKVIRPTDTQASGKNLPTTAQLAEALRAVPDTQRAYTQTVILSPMPAPDSDATHTVGGKGGGGEIDLFPVPEAQTQTDFDNRIQHESGHNYQGHLWQSAQDVRAWQDAADADNRRPSPYAAKNAGEDFSEFIILYNAVKGTACEATARQMYPNRWQKMAGY